MHNGFIFSKFEFYLVICLFNSFKIVKYVKMENVSSCIITVVIENVRLTSMIGS